MSYFNCHAHTMYSNIRLLDCINRPDKLIEKAYEMGMSGIAITDHECLSAHMEVNQFMKKFRKEHPNFTVALGNEIYLTFTRETNQKYWHFLLIAKDEIGHKGLRELSTIAWKNSYIDRRMERVPTLKDELAEVMLKYRGHIIATSACMGGELSTNAYAMAVAQEKGDMEAAKYHYGEIQNFMSFVLQVFGDDFYIECAPSTRKDQITTNRKLLSIARAYNVPIVVGTDAHFMTEADHPIHNGEREVDDFYEFARLMTPDECAELLFKSFDADVVDEIFENSKKLQDKIQWYSLERKQIIPKVEVKDYQQVSYDIFANYPILNSLFKSDNVQERYWAHECHQALVQKGIMNDEYLARLETEADVIKYIGEQLDDCLFAYFNTFKHYIDLFWECGSTVGPGRGSATGFLSNYLLGITQLDPIRWGLPYWRFLNKERAELPSLLLILGSCKKRTLTIA